MATGAIYNVTTGFIEQTIIPPLRDANQLAGLEQAGRKQVIIPDGKDGGMGMIDLATGEYVDFQPPGAPVPHLLAQIAAAFVNKGLISSDDLHPKTLSEINAQLSDARMATVSVAAKVGA